MNDEAVSPPETITLLIERANAGDLSRFEDMVDLSMGSRAPAIRRRSAHSRSPDALVAQRKTDAMKRLVQFIFDDSAAFAWGGESIVGGAATPAN